MRPPLLLLIALIAALSGGCDRPPAPSEAPPTAPGEPAKASPSAAVPCEPCVGSGEARLRDQAARRVHDVHVHTNAEAVPLLIEHLDRAGIDRIVNLSGGSVDSRMEKNLLVEALTGGRVVPFYTVPWSRLEEQGSAFAEEVAAELRLLVPLGVSGVKVSKGLGLGAVWPDGTLVAVDDVRLDPIWRAAGELGIPVSIHTSDPKAFFDPITPENERYEELSAHPRWSFADPKFPRREALLAARDRLLARHPKTTFICVHFANNPEDVDAVDRMLDAHPNALVDISARLGEIGRHDAARVREIFIKHRARILFGTDFMFSLRRDGLSVVLGSSGEEPATLEEIPGFFAAHWRFLESSDEAMPNPVPIQGRWDIHPLGLPEDVLEDIYRKNAERVIFTPHDRRRAARLQTLR